MKRRTARRGTVVASVAVVGLTVGAGAFVADAAHPASTAPTGSAAASGEAIKLGIMAECEGAFGGFNEDVIAGVTLAMINQAGATSNSRTTATDGFSGATAGGLPIDVVSVGCGNDTPDRTIQEIRKIVEQDGAKVVLGPLSGDEASPSPTTPRTIPRSPSSTASRVAGGNAAGAGPELLPLHR